jgi:hypothetical protein
MKLDRIEIKLKRLFETENSTIGRLFVNDKFFTNTLELLWRNNQRSISCIPKGTYKLRIRETENRGKHIILEGTEPRQFILIHSASTHKDLKGCIALGDRFTIENNEALFSQSKIAVARFNELVFSMMKDSDVWLVIE